MQEYRASKQKYDLASKDSSAAAFQALSKVSQEAEATFKLLDQELKSAQGGDKAQIFQRFQRHKDEMTKIRKEVQEIKLKENQDFVMGGNWNEKDDPEGNKSLLKENALLSDQNKKLTHAIRVGREAEVVAKDTKVQLYSDTEKMEKLRVNVRNIDGELTISDKLLNIIKKNETRNSLILYTVV